MTASDAAHMPPPEQEKPVRDDMAILKRDLTPTQAHMLTSLLRSCGIAAEAGDTIIVQMHSLLSTALGGAKIRVPQSQVEQALRLLAAFERGEFALDDDFDGIPSDPPHTYPPSDAP